MNTSWKTIIFYVLDVILAFYLVMAITSWNTPDKKHRICTKVNINISDSNNSGFLSAEEIKAILEKDKLYPLNRQLSSIEPRKIEEALKVGPFVDTAQCYITENGHINIRISQRMPIIRIKNNKGEDYYLDDNGGILPNSKYTSDLIIATGDISKWFAHFAITPMAKAINKSEFWLNQIEQINVRPDRGIELVPRVGNHIIFIGYLPRNFIVMGYHKQVGINTRILMWSSIIKLYVNEELHNKQQMNSNNPSKRKKYKLKYQNKNKNK